MEWRMVPEKWDRVDLDVNDPAQLAKAFEKVAEVRRVTIDEARALGLWHDDAPEDNPMPGRRPGRSAQVAPCADQHRRTRCSSRGW